MPEVIAENSGLDVFITLIEDYFDISYDLIKGMLMDRGLDDISVDLLDAVSPIIGGDRLAETLRHVDDKRDIIRNTLKYHKKKGSYYVLNVIGEQLLGDDSLVYSGVDYKNVFSNNLIDIKNRLSSKTLLSSKEQQFKNIEPGDVVIDTKHSGNPKIKLIKHSTGFVGYVVLLGKDLPDMEEDASSYSLELGRTYDDLNYLMDLLFPAGYMIIISELGYVVKEEINIHVVEEDIGFVESIKTDTDSNGLSVSEDIIATKLSLLHNSLPYVANVLHTNGILGNVNYRLGVDNPVYSEIDISQFFS